MTFGFVILPLIICIVYLIYWILHREKWSDWYIDEYTGINIQFCVGNNDAFMMTSCIAVTAILLWLVQISLSIKDNANEYNATSIVLITTAFIIVIPFIIFDLVTDETTKIIICIGCAILILSIHGCIFWTQFYLIWLQNSSTSNRISTVKPQQIEMVNINHMQERMHQSTEIQEEKEQKQDDIEEYKFKYETEVKLV
eukprot:157644_1